MKKTVFLVTMAGAWALIPANAVPRPGGTGEPQLKREVLQDVANQAAAEQEAVAYLGLSGAPASDLMTEHLGIQGGLVISLVSPNSPAEQAGFQQNDILTELDGVPLSTQGQLRDVVLARAVGDTVEITVLRRGKALQLQATFGQRPVQNSSDQARLQQLFGGALQNFPRGAGDRAAADIMQLMHERMAEMDKRFGNQQMDDLFGRALNPHDLNGQLDKFRQMFGQLDGAQGEEIPFESNSTFSLRDSEGSITLKDDGAGKKITVLDPQGAVVFEGPFQTVEERAAVPVEIQERLQGVRFDGMVLDEIIPQQIEQEDEGVPLLQQE